MRVKSYRTSRAASIPLYIAWDGFALTTSSQNILIQSGANLGGRYSTVPFFFNL